LHRAEGFGLAPAEMMYLGKPVIATGWSANTDFMNPDNSFPVHFQLQALKQAVGVYPAGPLWAEADIGHASACLTRLLDDPDLRQTMGERAAASIRRQFSAEAAGATAPEYAGSMALAIAAIDRRMNVLRPFRSLAAPG
jgi:glycosyltransferase involved in cell wall biosynthesis